MLGAGAQAIVTGWLFYFFTTFCALTAVEAGLILGLPRLLESISCPLIGFVSDNLRLSRIGRRVGRRRLFLLIVLPLLPGFVLLFVIGQGFWYYLFVFVLFELLYTMFLIPWETLAAEMSKDYAEKARFAGARMLVAQASAVLASYLPTLLIHQFGGEDAAQPFFWMAAVFGGLFSGVVLLVLLTTWERPYTGDELGQPVARLNWAEAVHIPGRMFRDLASTLRIRAFRQHLSLYLGGYLSQDIFNTAFPIFAATVLTGTLGATKGISQLMTVMYLAQLVSVMVAIRVVIRVGPVFAYRAAITLFIAAALLYGWLYVRQRGGGPSPSLLWLFGPIVLAGLGRGTLNFVPWSVYNYLPDIDEAVTGQRREGIFAGVMTLVRKLTQSMAIVATGWIIDAGGYVSPASRPGLVVAQTEGAIQTVTMVLVLGPVLVMLLGLWATWRFRLNSVTHRVLVNEVERLRQGVTEPETPASRRIVEDLTGWRFEDLWGRRGKRHPASREEQLHGNVPRKPVEKPMMAKTLRTEPQPSTGFRKSCMKATALKAESSPPTQLGKAAGGGSRKQLLVLLGGLLCTAAAMAAPVGRTAERKPNIVLILIDDMGYGDIQPFGCTNCMTPALDRMAKEGLKFTSFYAAPVCSASRAQIQTGCYAPRVSIPGVLGPNSAVGLNPGEHTVAKLLKAEGYATMCIGKWHLGDQPEFFPTRYGFDHYFGLPYSNDMLRTDADSGKRVVPLMRDHQVISLWTEDDQDQMARLYTEEAVKFIKANQAHPFYLYLAHNAVHFPIHPGPEFCGKSGHGRYYDWVEEVDWSAGRVLDTLRELHLATNTLVIFTSDNGPWLVKGKDAGSAGPLRGGKGSTWEGGLRESTLAWWPGHVPSGRATDAVAGEIDLLPTFVSLAGGTVSADQPIDGADISKLLLGKSNESAREAHFYYQGYHLQAVRSGPWKLALKPQNFSMGIQEGGVSQPGLRLYNLDTDISETADVSAQHPEMVQKLKALAEREAAALCDGPSGGPGVRPPGQVQEPHPVYHMEKRAKDNGSKS